MTLLQISEPEEKQKQDLNQYAIGIDLGTTNSVVSCVLAGEAKALGPILPSIHQGIRSIKRLMGSNEKVKSLTPVEVSSKILAKLKKQAEDILGETVTKSVITVPAHFDDAARNDTKLAAKLAGLEVMRLINEPTAAAMSYGLDHRVEGIYLIYDFGGGTFDVSILRMEKGIFQVLATGGDGNLGGDDIDHKIMEYLNLDEDSHHIAKGVKENLKYEEHKLSQDEFNDIAKPFIDRTLKICEETIKHSGVKVKDIKEIVLVGGSTRIPLVKQMITESIKKPLDTIDPDLAVSFGAAIQANGLIHGSDHLLIDVTSLSIGLEVMGGMNERVIPKNSPLPLSVSKQFTTYQDGQTGIIFHIVQGEREMVADCRSLAKFELKGIPPMKASLARVEVTFNLDLDGLLTVSAIEKISGVKQEVKVMPSYGLSEEEVERMIEESYIHAGKDIKAKQLAEAKLSSKDNISNINKAINDDGDLLSTKEKENLEKIILKLSDLIEYDNLEAIEKTNDVLENESSKFIQDRLNRQIKQILGGKDVKDVGKSML